MCVVWNVHVWVIGAIISYRLSHDVIVMTTYIWTTLYDYGVSDPHIRVAKATAYVPEQIQNTPNQRWTD